MPHESPPSYSHVNFEIEIQELVLKATDELTATLVCLLSVGLPFGGFYVAITLH
jgi:hypothetical protein